MKCLKLRFLHLYPRFFWMELRPRLIHAAIDRSVFNFFWAIPSFFFFFVFVLLRHILNLEPDIWRAWSPFIFSLTLHLSDLKPSPSPSFSNQKPSPHPPSPISTFASPSISDQKPSSHPPSLISTVTLHLSNLNPRLTLHWRSHPHPHPPFPISTLASPSTSTTTTTSRPISGFGFWDFPNQHSRVFLLSPCQFSWLWI